MNLMIELRQRRAELTDKAEALNKKAEVEDRDFTAEEQEEFDQLVNETIQLGRSIEDLLQDEIDDLFHKALNEENMTLMLEVKEMLIECENKLDTLEDMIMDMDDFIDPSFFSTIEECFGASKCLIKGPGAVIETYPVGIEQPVTSS